MGMSDIPAQTEYYIIIQMINQLNQFIRCCERIGEHVFDGKTYMVTGSFFFEFSKPSHILFH